MTKLLDTLNFRTIILRINKSSLFIDQASHIRVPLSIYNFKVMLNYSRVKYQVIDKLSDKNINFTLKASA